MAHLVRYVKPHSWKWGGPAFSSVALDIFALIQLCVGEGSLSSPKEDICSGKENTCPSSGAALPLLCGQKNQSTTWHRDQRGGSQEKEREKRSSYHQVRSRSLLLSCGSPVWFALVGKMEVVSGGAWDSKWIIDCIPASLSCLPPRTACTEHFASLWLANQDLETSYDTWSHLGTIT